MKDRAIVLKNSAVPCCAELILSAVEGFKLFNPLNRFAPMLRAQFDQPLVEFLAFFCSLGL
jgi:hypothetical protein